MITKDEALIVFAKPAVPGQVKTRLVPPLSAEEAAEFHLALLADLVTLAGSVAAWQVELCVAGETEAVAGFRHRYPYLTVTRQQGAGLGARLRSAFERAFARGVRRTLIVGSDHPTLPAAYLAQGFLELAARDVVFGPTRDGGYYAIGLRADAWPSAQSVLDEIPWSTPHVLEVSRVRAEAAGLSVALLPEWYDVDGPEDLVRVERDASTDSAVARFLRERGRWRA